LQGCARSVWRLAVLAAALVAVPVVAIAQPQASGALASVSQAATAQPSRQELNPAARIMTAPAVQQDIFSPEPPGPCPLKDSTVSFTLTSVTLKGATALPAAQLARAYRRRIGQRLAVAAICDIRDRVARIMFDRGILARVEIPAQTIAGGALTLEVIEAHVVNVRVRGDAGRAEAAVERYIGKLRGMTPFDMRKAQRYLLLASDIAGVQIRAAVRPSITGERGAVDLDITVIAHPVDAVANIQNDGSRTVGRFAGLARVDVDSLTDFGDRSSLVASHTLTNDEQWVIQLLEEARLGGDGLILRGSVVYGETRPGGATAELDLVSQSFVSEAEAAYPLIRSRRYNLNLAGGFDLIDAFTNAAGAPLYRDKLRVFYGRVDGDARFLALRRVFQVSGAFSVRKGVDGLGSSTPGVDESLTAIPTTRPQGRPNAWRCAAPPTSRSPSSTDWCLAARSRRNTHPTPCSITNSSRSAT
jgi:hemolysin activation/secretion protein